VIGVRTISTGDRFTFESGYVTTAEEFG